MRHLTGMIFILMAFLSVSSGFAQTDYAALSAELLTRVKHNQPTEALQQQLADASADNLAESLDSDVRRKTFWLNVYNSYIILILRENPDLYEDRDAFFKANRIPVAGLKLSFDEIEHGILRRSKVKLSYGYLDKAFVDDFEKSMRVDQVDWRIHFALNCGAAACPPVEVYEVATLNQQLTDRARQYLQRTTRYRPAYNEVTVTTLANWFRADFGGASGTLDILRDFGIIPEDATPDIEYGDYDWTLDIDNFANEE